MHDVGALRGVDLGLLLLVQLVVGRVAVVAVAVPVRVRVWRPLSAREDPQDVVRVGIRVPTPVEEVVRPRHLERRQLVAGDGLDVGLDPDLGEPVLHVGGRLDRRLV